jgi:hypothetical protein
MHMPERFHHEMRAQPKPGATRRRQKHSRVEVTKPPVTSDQAPGEETVQVNDKYVGGGPPPEKEPAEHIQHQTGG